MCRIKCNKITLKGDRELTTLIPKPKRQMMIIACSQPTRENMKSRITNEPIISLYQKEKSWLAAKTYAREGGATRS